MYMVRKQLYIEDEQELRLKRRAQELGVSEAEVVRRALDHALSETLPGLPGSIQGAALTALLETADRIATESEPTGAAPFRREDAYEEREARLYR